jgi:hypothetical protein
MKRYKLPSKSLLAWFLNCFWLFFWFFIILSISNWISWDKELDQSTYMKLLFFSIVFLAQILFIKRLTHMQWTSFTPIWVKERQKIKIGPLLLLTSHHPSNDSLESHELTICNIQWCSGCYAMTVGTIISFLLLLAIFYIDITIFSLNYLYICLLGILFIQTSLSKYILPQLLNWEPTGLLRFFLNALLPIGLIMCLIGTYAAEISIFMSSLSIFGLLPILGFRFLLAYEEHYNIERQIY